VEEVIAMARLCIALAQTLADLTAWGRAHAAILASLPEYVLTAIRAAYADRLAVLKERQ
jgi:Flp pilus assembly protein TadB